MSAYYSSETTIKNKLSASRINMYGDKDRDGELDPETLTQALIYAKQQILMRFETRFGAQCNDWTDVTVPDALRNLSDDLTIYYLATGANAVNEIVKLNYEIAIDMLNEMRDGLLSLPGVSDYEAGTEIVTASSESIYSAEADENASTAYNDDI